MPQKNLYTWVARPVLGNPQGLVEKEAKRPKGNRNAHNGGSPILRHTQMDKRHPTYPQKRMLSPGPVVVVWT